MNEAISNFNALVSGEKSISVKAKVPNEELLKVGLVMFSAFFLAFIFALAITKY